MLQCLWKTLNIPLCDASKESILYFMKKKEKKLKDFDYQNSFPIIFPFSSKKSKRYISSRCHVWNRQYRLNIASQNWLIDPIWFSCLEFRAEVLCEINFTSGQLGRFLWRQVTHKSRGRLMMLVWPVLHSLCVHAMTIRLFLGKIYLF